MARNKKASLLKRANELGIPTFGEPTVQDLESRIKYWKPGPGWLCRRLHQKALPTWAGDIPHGDTLWIPDSSFAHRLMRTGRIVLLGRPLSPPEGTKIIDPAKYISEEEE